MLFRSFFKVCALEGDPIDSQSIVKSIVESEMFPIDSQSIKYFYFVFFPSMGWLKDPNQAFVHSFFNFIFYL